MGETIKEIILDNLISHTDVITQNPVITLKQQVYFISVDDSHRFIFNGINYSGSLHCKSIYHDTLHKPDSFKSMLHNTQTSEGLF